MKLEPLYDRLIVRIIENRRTAGGLWIPEMATAGTPYLVAEVVSVGHGRITSQGGVVPLMVKEGDVVLFFRQSSGEQIVLPEQEPGEEWMAIREAHVVGIMRDLDKASNLVSVDGKTMVLQ